MLGCLVTQGSQAPTRQNSGGPTSYFANNAGTMCRSSRPLVLRVTHVQPVVLRVDLKTRTLYLMDSPIPNLNKKGVGLLCIRVVLLVCSSSSLPEGIRVNPTGCGWSMLWTHVTQGSLRPRAQAGLFL